jgi:ABC-2 type transport system ATP-binding protein
VRLFDLPRDKRLRTLSRGVRVKAALLSSLAYRPRLLVLDEPFAGLDPLVRDEFVSGVLELTASEGWTIFVASHDVDEVERLADWVGIINAGRLQVSEPVTSLLARFRQVEVTMDGEARLPQPLPARWLHPEQAGHVVRFVDSAYQEGDAGPWEARFPQARTVSAAPMSLRSIFVALARTYRLADSNGGMR